VAIRSCVMQSTSWAARWQRSSRSPPMWWTAKKTEENAMDLNQLMKMAGEMRQRLADSQQEIEDSRVVGESGGGLVRVVMNGRHEILELHIDPKTMVPSEVALVEDLVRAAVNQASQKASGLLKERMAQMAQQMGVDPSMLGGGLGL